MINVIIDFETYYDNITNLTKMDYIEYVANTKTMCVTTVVDGYPITTDQGQHLYNYNWNEIRLIGHNLAFDALMLKTHFDLTPKEYFCTLSASRLIYPSSQHDLEALRAKLFPSMPGKQHGALYKTKGKQLGDLTPNEYEQLKQYNINDCLITKALFNCFWPLVPEFEKQLIHHTVDLWLKPRLELNVTNAKIALEQEIQEKQKIFDNLQKTTGISLADLRSNKKLAEWFREHNYKFPTKKSPCQKDSNGNTVDIPAFGKNDKAFDQMIDIYPELTPIIEAKRLSSSNISQTRMKRLIKTAELCNGKVPICYNYAKAITGRFSGSNKTNMQNLPRGSALRNCLTAPEDHIIIAGDLSQIEARILAWLAKEDKILEAFQMKKDLYSEVASTIYGFPVNKKNHPNERWVGKVATLGLGYGMSAEKFKIYTDLQGGKLTQEFCNTVVSKWRTEFNKIPKLWSLFQSFLQTLIYGEQPKEKKEEAYVNKEETPPKYFDTIKFYKNTMILPSRRKIHYENMRMENNSYIYGNGTYLYGAKLVENAVQAISRDILGIAILNAHKQYPIVMHTHDEIITCVPETEAETAKQFIYNTLITPPEWANDLPIDAEVGMGKTYGECK